ATPKVHPNLWTPRSGLELMNNDLPSTNLEDSMSCFDFSKNDSCLISATGGMISIFDMKTFKTMKKVMPPPPAATCLAFHPRDDSIVAIGMDNSTIVIYNLHSDEVTRKLEGHAKRVTSLAFSNTLNIYVWGATGWEKHRSKLLQIPDGKELKSLSYTYIQIHQNELHLVAINKTHLAVYEVKELACV
ncbi:TOPLESS-related 1, partial [Prunus dulcis]